MYKQSEGFFKGYQDTNLFFELWESPKARGTLIITHGQGEYSGAYSRLIEGLSDQNLNIYSWDLRGHGRSDGRRGYAANFDDYCRDCEIFLKMVMSEDKVKKGPVILLGHSMGGLILTKTLLHNSGIQADALVLSAPLFGISVPVPAFKSKGAKVLNALLPALTMGNELQNDMLTRDLDVIREFEQDALRHDKLSSAVFLGMLESFDFVLPRATEIRMPMVLMISDNDPVVSTEAARAFYGKVGSEKKELFIYPSAKHEIFNDTIRQTVYQDLKKYLAPYLEAKS